MIRLRSPQADALCDQLRSLPDGLAISLLVLGRQLSVLASKGGRWLRHQRRKRRKPQQPSATGALEQVSGKALVPGPCLLVRIIGNDLQPLHDADQSLNNLRFILEHEPPLQGCEKRWLLNRISDPAVLGSLRALLDAHGCGYDVIPYEADRLRSVPWDWAVLPRADFLVSRRYRSLPVEQQHAWLMALYRNKNNALMHNNGARNRALELARQRPGSSRPHWILPWDGNCFLTPDAWRQIRQVLADRPDVQYFHVPMQRITSNAQLLDSGFRAAPRDEPQLIFSAVAPERFNPDCPYGRRPKVELFWRLGLAGPWDDWQDEAWDQPRRPRLNPPPACPPAGWVARLQPGGGRSLSVLPEVAPTVSLSPRGRSLTRNMAIQCTILTSLLPDSQVLNQALLQGLWEVPLEDARRQAALLQAAEASARLLGHWLQWWDHGGPAPAVSGDQLIHAFTQVVWQTALMPGTRVRDLSWQQLERLMAVWFAPGRRGLQPKLRHRWCRPLAARLPGLGPGPAELLQLALLSDLLVFWCPPASWTGPFEYWRLSLLQDWQRRQPVLMVGLNLGDQQRLRLALSLLYRHVGCLVDSVNSLLPLLGMYASAKGCKDPCGVQGLDDLALRLAEQLGLLDQPLTPQQSSRTASFVLSLLLSPARLGRPT